MDNRKDARSLTLLTGKVVAPSTRDSVDCAVLNISQSGACILIPKNTEISEPFILEIDHDLQARNCRIAWRSGCRVGLVFDGAE